MSLPLAHRHAFTKDFLKLSLREEKRDDLSRDGKKASGALP